MAPTRLINTRTLDFEAPNSPDTRYAILSHRWDDGEVSFQEWENRRNKPEVTHRNGYAKIQAFCRQALSDGFSHVWADTNCIDKTNFSELSEAINSMFNWYRDASVCYVYLHDLASDKKLSGSISLETYGRDCQWFSRGWTLQELLAPKNMRFYALDWTCLGSKKDLCHVLADLTGIGRKYILEPGHIFSASISERMSWASKRQTGKPEDIAYSLIGLFDINMPLLYGEGAIKAFRRLQEEIIKVSTDQSIFAWEWPRGWASSTQDWVSLLAPAPVAFRHSGIYLPDDRLLDATSCIYSMSNYGLSISLQILPTMATHSAARRHLPAPTQLVLGGLHCVAEYDSTSGTEAGTELSRARSLVAIPLVKHGNSYFRVAFPPMPIPISALWSQEQMPISAPRLRAAGDDVYSGNDVYSYMHMAYDARDKLNSRYCFFLCSPSHSTFEIGESASTSFWTPLAGLSCFVGKQNHERSREEALVVSINHQGGPDSQFNLFLALTIVDGRDVGHCEIRQAGRSSMNAAMLKDWMKDLHVNGNDYDTGAKFWVRLEDMINMPNGMKIILVCLSVDPDFRPSSVWSARHLSSSVASVIR